MEKGTDAQIKIIFSPLLAATDVKGHLEVEEARNESPK
ncbi:hypothetical protein PanWU01x14_167330 [Parasponia andersonii]|uniref:Uncharacterized protein n=1 Tax=Parasponia andersonii TaxID=3476 RepID=A0A2P5CBD7_PARAD|nr:hypothetical protein PanWU01x14_167330 [Parasponia andersonii]